MNSIHRKIGLIGAAALMLMTAAPAFALDVNVGGSAGVSAGSLGVSATADAKIALRLTRGKERADQEIQRRIKKLTEVGARVQAMARVSAATKANIAAETQSEITALTALDAKIQGDPDFDLLRMDIKSITESYRIFLLIIPQAHITVAADKMMTVSGSLTTLAAKLKTRIDAAAAAGKDVGAMTASYTDLNAKIADIGVQSTAAVSAVSSLTPDLGDKTKMEANQQSLKDGRAKIKAGMKDVDSARADARAIIKVLKALDVEANASLNSEVNSAGKTH